MTCTTINTRMLERAITNARTRANFGMIVQYLPGYNHTKNLLSELVKATDKKEVVDILNEIITVLLDNEYDIEDALVSVFFYEVHINNKTGLNVENWCKEKIHSMLNPDSKPAEKKAETKVSSPKPSNKVVTKQPEETKAETKVSSPKPSNKVVTKQPEEKKTETKVSSPKETSIRTLVGIGNLINRFEKVQSSINYIEVINALSILTENNNVAIRNVAIALLKFIEVGASSLKYRNSFHKKLASLYQSFIDAYRVDPYGDGVRNVINLIKAETDKISNKVVTKQPEEKKAERSDLGKPAKPNTPASQPIVATPVESPKAGKGLKFNIDNFVKPQPAVIATTEQTSMQAESSNSEAQVKERKVYNPRPGKSLEDKVKELKTHISFGPSEGKAISEDQLNAMINFFIDGKGFKKQMKKMGCKANLNTIHLTEVSHDKYDGIDDKFDMVFEVPTNKASNPIIIMYCSTPEWNEQINSFVSSREIKMASEMKLSKKKDKVPEKKPEKSSVA